MFKLIYFSNRIIEGTWLRWRYWTMTFTSYCRTIYSANPIGAWKKKHSYSVFERIEFTSRTCNRNGFKTLLNTSNVISEFFCNALRSDPYDKTSVLCLNLDNILRNVHARKYKYIRYCYIDRRTSNRHVRSRPRNVHVNKKRVSVARIDRNLLNLLLLYWHDVDDICESYRLHHFWWFLFSSHRR